MENNFKYTISRKKKLMFPFFMLLFLFVGGWVVMALWNAILPVVIPAVKVVSYWQAVGILLLSRLLFGGFKGHHRGGEGYRHPSFWKEKMAQMTDEEKEKCKEAWKSRCGRP